MKLSPTPTVEDVMRQQVLVEWNIWNPLNASNETKRKQKTYEPYLDVCVEILLATRDREELMFEICSICEIEFAFSQEKIDSLGVEKFAQKLLNLPF